MNILQKINLFFKKYNFYIFLVYLILPIIFFTRYFFTSFENRLYLGNDFLQYFDGFYYFIERIKGLSFPFWDPHIYQGLPFFARVDISIFYPINLIWSLIAILFKLNIYQLYIFYELYPLFHLSLGGFFVYILAKSFNISKFGSFLSGLIFMFSGTLLIIINAVPLITSLIWLPIILFFYKKFLEKKSLFYCLITILLISLSHFAGTIQVSLFYNGLFFLFFLFYWCFINKLSKIEKSNKILQLALIFIISILIYSVQFIPSLQFSILSNRQNISFDTATMYGAVKPMDIIDLLIPNFSRYIENGMPVNLKIVYLYFGILPLILFIFGFFSKEKISKFFIFTFFLFLLASFGGYISLYQYIVLYLPGFNMFRNVSKILYLSSLSFSLIAGFGYDYIINAKKLRKWKFNIYLLKRTFLLFLSISFVFIIIQFIFFYFKNINLTINISLLESLINSVYIFLIFAIISIILIYFLSIVKNDWLIKFIIVIFIIIDLSNFNQYITSNNFNYKLNTKYYLSSEVDFLNIIKKDKDLFRVIFISGIYGQHYAPEIFNLYNAGGYSSMALKSASSNVLSITYTSTLSEDYAKILSNIGIKYVISGVKLDNKDFELIQEDSVSEDNLKYYFKYSGDSIGVVNRDIGEKVYLYKNKAFDGLVLANSNYIIKNFDPENIIILFNSNRNEEIEVKILDYPGWEVYVNNKKVSHTKNEFGYINFQIPSGDVTVNIRYFSKLFYLSLGISVASILVIILIILKNKKNNY